MKQTTARGRKRSPDSFLNTLDSLASKDSMIFIPTTKINRNYASSMITAYSNKTGKRFETVGGTITKGTTPANINETVEGFWLIRKA